MPDPQRGEGLQLHGRPPVSAGIPARMAPDQLRAAASHLRLRYRPPVPSMPVNEYLSSEGIHALAWALEEVAREEEEAAD